MSIATCPKCGNTDVSWIRDDADYAHYICLECKQEFCYPPKTLFKHLMTSPEVLAPKFIYTVYTSDGEQRWCSALLEVGSWFSEREAIAATVARLKEVCDERHT